MNSDTPRFVYFGGEPLGVPVLEALLAVGLRPELVVCNPDRPTGRSQDMTAPPVKQCALAAQIPVLQPNSLKDKQSLSELTDTKWDLFVVVAYNKILPEWLVDFPTYKTLNVHPSLLPKLRGPSPIRSAIVRDEPSAIGVSIMLMDAEMDHGPILAQEKYTIDPVAWPIDGRVLDTALAARGGAVLAQTIPAWIAGTLTAQPQQHTIATYTAKLSKTDGELHIDPHDLPSGDIAREILCKIRGLAGWPGTFFFYNGKRIKIAKAELVNDQLRLLAVVPEGKREQSFTDWLQR